MASARQSESTKQPCDDLVTRLQRGDEAAFEELVRTHGAAMLRTAERILIDGEEAREITQEAFIAVHACVGEFRHDSRLSTWLHRIVVNRALMRLRSRRRDPGPTSIEELLPTYHATSGHFVDPPAPWEVGPSALAQRGELRAQVRQCIEQLPEPYRVALMLRDIEGLSNSEVAAALEISTSATKVRVHRARQALRALLRPHIEGGEE